MGFRRGARLSTGHVVLEVRRGGFSEVAVVKGAHDELLAVKRISDEVRAQVGEGVDRAFLRECELAVKVLGDVPHTARPRIAIPVLSQSGPDDVGIELLGPALYMDYVNGPSLADLLRTGPLSLSQSARVCGYVAESLARALDSAGEPRVVHRDMKPSNILLTRANEVRLIDWGLSEVKGVSGLSVRIEYLSPQRAADMDLADPADDVYALGMVLHQCLTGRFPGYDVRGGTGRLRQDLAERCPDVPEELANMVVAMLSPRPDNRPEARSIAGTLLHPDMTAALAQRDLTQPFCRDCGLVGRAVPCAVCGGEVRRRVAREPAPGMVRVPAGTFVHGLTEAQVRHALIMANMAPTDDQVRVLTGSGVRRVHCPAFDIDRTPVTNEEYAVFLQKVGYPEPEGFKAALAEAPDHPVTSVSWKDALCYALWRGKRLPTPLEWEKAARGAEDDRMYPWGNTFEAERCVHRRAPGAMPTARTVRTGPVGRLPGGQSPWGVHDLVGNVNEWVSEGKTPGFRGACGGAAGEVLPVYGLVSYQSQAHVDYASTAVGFRCAADVVHDVVPYDGSESSDSVRPGGHHDAASTERAMTGVRTA
ncbi:SUMF1/EgtB/PvdO family nonheme iron enzyme [Streptomyces sp. Ru72]|uniref:SUMF1/EgtB/PvdO family nonheme iron enzyme n=1 Tax=Streptomyces sp. Ru72 TaxID=2080747 RepID=UPI000CDD2293|nr:SUMF1/EgtB/PvdO family nonheme iron enzyme [Streptomyces sp. Ru72]POX52434.1 hypothetical protein C3488_08410 [Streptomyces sp. Ru72]